jgi:hypothetical protein
VQVLRQDVKFLVKKLEYAEYALVEFNKVESEARDDWHQALEIGRHNGTTVALDATDDRLQASKKAPAPSLSERVHELTRENGQFRLEIRFYQQKQDAVQVLRQDVKFLAEKLEYALVEYNKVESEARDDWHQALEGVYDT